MNPNVPQSGNIITNRAVMLRSLVDMYPRKTRRFIPSTGYTSSALQADVSAQAVVVSALCMLADDVEKRTSLLIYIAFGLLNAKSFATDSILDNVIICLGTYGGMVLYVVCR